MEQKYILSNGFPEIEDVKTLLNAITLYGRTAQTDIAIEEMSELTKAILKLRRADGEKYFKARNDLIDEIADVLVCTKQLLIIYDCYSEVSERMEFKVQRLKKRMEG